jgi:SpoVK/Ycf46/Vps4 family AAA+-type ATPase
MNNYEKRKFLDYLDKLAFDTDFTEYCFDDVFDFILDEYKIDKKIFQFDKHGNLLLETQKQRQKFVKIFKNTIRDLKSKIKPRATVLERQFLTIKNIYSLNNDEYEILQFLVLKEINNIFDRYFDCIHNPALTTFVRCYLNMRFGKKERVMNNLYLKNIIDGRRSESINPEFLKIFDNPKCNTQEKIVAVIIGKKEKSTLTIDDYKHLKNEPQKIIKILSSAVKRKKKGINILLYGGVGTGKTEFAKLVANEADIPMYSVITQKQDFGEPNREDRMIDLFSKQHLLSHTSRACILLDEAEDIMNRGFSSFGNASKGYLNDLLENSSVPVIWTTNNIMNVDPAFLRRMTYCVEFEKLSEETRLTIWEKTIKKNKFKVCKEKIEELNKNYDIPPSLISNAVEATKMIGGNENDFEDFIENVARVVTKKKNVKTNINFEVKDYDINLVNTDIDIDDLTHKIQKSDKLKFSLCMYGEPGTGKSLYGRYLANVLGVEVVFKRASDLISKWVGETEQNIAAAFAEAKSKKAMLIFDEADSFLQNRNNAHNSWEISQVNEMLTWMESHEYPFICTTNLLDTLDEASLRRFTFKIKFDFMTTAQVNHAIEHFFGIQNANINIKGLTAGDFATVKKKVDFLEIKDLNEIIKMLNDEVKVKKSKTLQDTIGF